MPSQPHWLAPTPNAPVDALVQLPGSKSLTNRELVLSALADTPSMLRAPLHSRDSALMLTALQQLGVGIELLPGEGAFGPDIRVHPMGGMPDAPTSEPVTIDCGLAGTVMRFVPPVAALTTRAVRFDGDEYARSRPMDGLLTGLSATGVHIHAETPGHMPFTLHGTGSVRGGRVTIDSSRSSQFVSALLLSGARFDNGIHVVHTGEKLPSVPHIEMTLHAVRERGGVTDASTPGAWRVEAGPLTGRDLTIEPDLSNAAPFLAAALITGGTVRIPHWPNRTTQVGDDLRTILPAFGATVTHTDGILTVSGGGSITGANLDLSHAGELVPALAALAALATSPSELTGIGHLRHHETDRLAALRTEINRLGGHVTELDDGLRINPRPLRGGEWLSYADHRMATTGALLGLAVPGIHVVDVACTSKTLPQFTELWHAMLAGGEPDTGAGAGSRE